MQLFGFLDVEKNGSITFKQVKFPSFGFIFAVDAVHTFLSL